MSITLSPSGRNYTIGDVAKLIGVSISWIRHQETKGTIPAPRRTPTGHRIYSHEEVLELRSLVQSDGLLSRDRRSPYGIRIAVINQKGGVGKTTVTQNLGLALGNQGHRCLLVDLDRQYNLTSSFGINIEDVPESGLGYALCRSAQGEDGTSTLEKSLIHTQNPGVDLIPTDLRMFDAENALRNDRYLTMSPHRLANTLAPVSERYDFTLIDCPPDLGILTTNGLVSAQGVLIPVDHDFSTRGLTQLLGTLTQIEQSHHRLPIVGVVINKFDSRTNIGQIIEEKIRKNFGDRLFSTRIAHTSRIQESQFMKTPLVEYDPRHTVSRQFDALAREFRARVQDEWGVGH